MALHRAFAPRRPVAPGGEAEYACGTLEVVSLITHFALRVHTEHTMSV